MYTLTAAIKTCDTNVQQLSTADLFVRNCLIQVDHTVTDGTTAATGFVRVSYATSSPTITPATALFSLSAGGVVTLPLDLSVQEDREYINLKNIWVKSTQANMVVRFTYALHSTV